MPIKLISGSGGSLTVQPAPTASNYTLTVPAVTANVITSGDTSTITPAMLSTGAPTWDASGNMTVTGTVVGGNAMSGMRNRIINGDMQVWQRATSSTLSGVVTYQSVDRWAARNSGGAAGAFSQSTSVPTGFQYSCKIGRNNGVSTAGAIELIHVLETVNSIPLQGQQVTLSFYAKAGDNFSATSSLMGASLYSGTGTDQAAASLGGWTGVNNFAGSTPALTTSWQRFTVTGTVPSNSTQLGIYLYYQAIGTSGADDNMYITGVQLEPGPVATPFERRMYGTEFDLCKRYYQTFGGNSANERLGTCFNYGTLQARLPLLLAPVMRATPTLTVSSGAHWSVESSSTVACTSVAFDQASPRVAALNFNVASGLTSGHGGQIMANATTSARINFSAEL